MVLQELWNLITEQVFPVESTCDLFNQYRDEEGLVDAEGAAAIRRRNLRSYVASYAKRPRTLVVGDAAGPWGCRFSGVPFTGEEQLLHLPELPFRGRRSSHDSINPSLLRQGPPPFNSVSAKAFWPFMTRYYRKPGFFVWDSVPFYPHPCGEILGKPKTKAAHRNLCADVLRQIIAILEPRTIVAVGSRAKKALRNVNRTYGLAFEFTKVRHPAYGGQPEFRAQTTEVFSRL